jgi:hypothetical protein
MLNGSESPNADAVSLSSLVSILEPEVANKYFLSARACAGILRRATRRNKKLPSPLAAALENVVGQATPTE